MRVSNLNLNLIESFPGRTAEEVEVAVHVSSPETYEQHPLSQPNGTGAVYLDGYTGAIVMSRPSIRVRTFHDLCSRYKSANLDRFTKVGTWIVTPNSLKLVYHHARS